MISFSYLKLIRRRKGSGEGNNNPGTKKSRDSAGLIKKI